jgi:hypothetical protein
MLLLACQEEVLPKVETDDNIEIAKLATKIEGG